MKMAKRIQGHHSDNIKVTWNNFSHNLSYIYRNELTKEWKKNIDLKINFSQDNNSRKLKQINRKTNKPETVAQLYWNV